MKRLLFAVAVISTFAACAGGASVTAPVPTAAPGQSPTPSPALSAVPQTQSIFALVIAQSNGVACGGDGGKSVTVYAAGTAAVSQSLSAPCAASAPVYDQNGALWGVAPFGIKPDGTSAGTFAPPGKVLAFDASGSAYVADPAANALDVYPSNSSSSMTRQINLGAPALFAAVDTSGNTYVAVATGVYEYAATASGNANPTASNLTARGPVATDGAGNVFAFYNAQQTTVSTIGIWQAGGFGPTAPQRTVSLPLTTPPGVAPPGFQPFGFGVDRFGDIYELAGGAFGFGGPVYYVPAGSTSYAQLPNQVGTPQYIAVPFR